MNKNKSSKMWPSADQHMIRYNAQQENGIELYEELFGESPIEDPFSYVYSIPKLMLRSIEYEIEIDEVITDYVRDYLTSINYSFTDELLENDYSINNETFLYAGSYIGASEPIDRTIKVELIDETIYSVDYVRHLQKFLTEEYPLWRIHVYASYIRGGESLTIYPEALVVGDNLSQQDDIAEVLNNWRQLIFNIREQIRGPFRRQLNIVKANLPETLEQLKLRLDQQAKPFICVSSIENCNDDNKKLFVWLLFAVKKGVSLRLNSLKPGSGCSKGKNYYVTELGELTDELCEHTISSQRYRICLQQFVLDVIPKEKNYNLVVNESQMIKNELQSTGKKWEFQLDVKDIITDDSLGARRE